MTKYEVDVVFTVEAETEDDVTALVAEALKPTDLRWEIVAVLEQ